MLAKRRESYRESLRTDILDAARQLFIKNGYEATSIRGIATKVGASPGILYHYFQDKQDILAHLVREAFTVLESRLTAIQTDDASIKDRLRRGLRAYIDFGLQNPHQYAMLWMKPETWEGSERVHLAFMEDGMRTFACLLRISRDAIDAGILRPELTDERELAQALWVSIHGLVSAQIGARNFPFVERERLIERQLDVLMHGVLRAGRRS
jgi:AcrR family transcriptional regulator